jgi:hypothetical protein
MQGISVKLSNITIKLLQIIKSIAKVGYVLKSLDKIFENTLFCAKIIMLSK